MIETLIAVGADWLAVELFETLNHGRWPEESEDVLALTRAQVRAGGEQKRMSEPHEKAVARSQIEPEEQVGWAANFVVERLDSAISELEKSIANLDVLIGEAPEDFALSKLDRLPTSLSLGREDGSDRVDAADLKKARLGIEALRKALTRWANESGGQTE
ncbi:MAG: hypothetical protein ACU0A4_17065 [Paracoccaceae bacterium]